LTEIDLQKVLQGFTVDRHAQLGYVHKPMHIWSMGQSTGRASSTDSAGGRPGSRLM